MLLDNTPAELKDAMQDAFSEKSNYLCNIFTCKRTLFKQFGEIAFKTAEQILAKMNDEKVDKKMLHPYWLAYVFERFTSCYFHAMQKAGNKFVKMPLVCVDAHSHIRWQKPDQQGAEDA